MSGFLKTMAFCFVLMLASASFSKELMVNDRLEIERSIEAYLHEVIEKHVEPGKFFLSVRVTLPEQAAEIEESTPAGETGLKTLPYTPLRVDLTFLSSLLKGGKVPDKFTNKVDTYEVRLTFDQSVPADTVTLIEERITYQLDINNSNRKIVTKKANLRTDTVKQEDPDQAAKIQLESARLENQRTKLEMERQKLETQKQMERLKDELKKAGEEKIADKPEEKKSEDQPVADAAPTSEDKSLLSMIRDFQPIIMAVIFVIFGILGVFLFSGSHKTGLSRVSDALGSLSEVLGKNSVVATDNPPIDSGLDKLAGSEQVSLSNENTSLSEKDERYEKFIKLVEEKIEVLSNEGNFNFYRHFLDLMQDNLKYAASLLVSVGDDSARKLLQNISPEAIAKLQDFLAEPGAHTEARALRSKALQDFYGRIAMDEYLGSPLATIRNTEWLLKMSTEELQNFIISLEEKDRVDLLACLTPTRIALMLDAAKDDGTRLKMIQSVKNVDKASISDLPSLFKRLEGIYQQKDNQLTDRTKQLFDGPRFFARIVNDLKPGSRDEFLRMLEDRKDILDGLKNFYIPFSELKLITENILKDIFGKRSASQVAKIIFVADQELRAKVINAMPEMLRDTVREDLEVLDNDSQATKKNNQVSLGLQEDICRYLLKLNKEGLLEYASPAGLKAVSDINSDSSAA